MLPNIKGCEIMTKKAHQNQEKCAIGRRGSITVEAALIVPFIFLGILLTLYITFILYQYASLQAVANNTAERVASIWRYVEVGLEMDKDSDTNRLSSTDVINGYVNIDDSRISLYSRLYDLKKSAKEEALENYIIDNVGMIEIANNRSISPIKPQVKYKRGVLGSSVEIIIEEPYGIPIDGINKIFGIEEKFTIRVRSQAVVDDPAELIRNIDFASDMIQKNEKLKDITEKTKDRMDNVRKKIEDILDND